MTLLDHAVNRMARTKRSQSARLIVACTGLSDVLVREKLDAMRLEPGVIIVTSSGSTSSCADAA